MKRRLIIVATAIVVVAAGCGNDPQPKKNNFTAPDTNAVKREAETYLTEDNLRPLIGDSGLMPSKYQLKLFGEGGMDTVRVSGMIGKHNGKGD
jgi:hypothetical protein